MTSARGPAPAVTFRPLEAADVGLVTDLHVTSWRTAYRGILSDAYLDGPVAAERHGHWARRLEAPQAAQAGVVAEVDGEPAGFLYLIADADPSRGTLLDNLHVLPRHRDHGLGRRLLSVAAAEITARVWPAGLHLWVFEANQGAQRFYARHGARVVAQVIYDAPDGGRYPALCYGWPDASVLLVSRGGRTRRPGPSPPATRNRR